MQKLGISPLLLHLTLYPSRFPALSGLVCPQSALPML
jgi:hypothetical protein